MSVSVVWLDLEHAKVFHFSDERMARETVHASRVDHHTHKRDNDERDCVPMYEALAAKLADSARVLILGPGVAKTHFLHHLTDKHPVTAKRVVGCESSDHPTDHQIAAYALKFFQKPVA